VQAWSIADHTLETLVDALVAGEGVILTATGETVDIPEDSRVALA